MFKFIRDYLGITLGCIITALGLAYFLIPNQIAAGGVSGLATVLHYLFGFKVGMIMLALDLPLFLIGLKMLGAKFGIKTLYGTVVLAVSIDIITPFVKVPTNDLLLACIYGGILTGLGVGIVFRFGATTGGTDLAARLIHKYLKVTVGKSLLFIDTMIILLAAVVFGIEKGLYAFLVIFITSKIIDLVQDGEFYSKAFLIISDKNIEISKMIMDKMERGVTHLAAKGGYTEKDKEVLLVVVSRSEVTTLKEAVAQIDPKAFMIVSSVNETLGEGFRDFNDH